jgi:hypothetical protein
MPNTKTAPATVGAVTGAKIRTAEAAQTRTSVATLRPAGEIPRALFDL